MDERAGVRPAFQLRHTDGELPGKNRRSSSRRRPGSDSRFTDGPAAARSDAGGALRERVKSGGFGWGEIFPLGKPPGGDYLFIRSLKVAVKCREPRENRGRLRHCNRLQTPHCHCPDLGWEGGSEVKPASQDTGLAVLVAIGRMSF